MKEQHSPCSFCGSTATTLHHFNGFLNLWASNLTDPRPYAFQNCGQCGYTKNLDYEDPDFASIDYSNHTLSLDADFREILLAEKMTAYAKNLFQDDHPLVAVEIGPGNRLGFLRQLIDGLMLEMAYAVDPIYRNHSSRSGYSFANAPFLIPSLREVSLPPLAHRIIIFRNSIEYYSPQALGSLFAEVFVQDSLLLVELTVLDVGKKGSLHTYSECRNFFSVDTLQAVLKDCGLSVIPMETTYLHGDGRVLWLARVIPDQSLPKLTIFTTVADLVQALSKLELNNKVVMWGAGGRNIMAIVNEMRPFVHHFTDVDIQRKDIELPPGVTSIDSGSIASNDIVICLNHRHLDSIRASIPDANVFLFLD
jgi:hypothetical protein